MHKRIPRNIPNFNLNPKNIIYKINIKPDSSSTRVKEKKERNIKKKVKSKITLQIKYFY
jgi:hypothetical protein